MLKRVARDTIFAAAGILAAVAVVEAWFRLTSATPLWHVLPVPEVSLYAPDEATGYSHRPGASGIWMTENRVKIQIPPSGLRDRDRSEEAEPALRAVVLGNSIFEALQVDAEATSSAVAERKLQSQGRDIAVLNLGLSGATPAIDAARLLSRGGQLKPAVAVVPVPFDEFMTGQTRDDSAYAGYRATDGKYQLSYGFRAGRGYRIRTSGLGNAMYAAIDHSLVATLLNNRKNIGLFAEFPTGARVQPNPPYDPCASAELEPHEALWLRSEPVEAVGVRDAFINDLARLQKDNGTQVVVLATGISARCPHREAERDHLLDVIKSHVENAGLRFADLDGRLVEKVGRAGIASLHGFGLSLGGGHLNEKGNAVYGEVLAEVIEEALAQTPSSRSIRAVP